ncbi:MAG: AMP-binding protein, partial [Xanthomonadaceae bacterium]|nr:AMP-binding protein [Xanthomonadaceae bacterium]
MTDPRPWLEHYPPGVPAEIDANVFPSIIAMFEQACTRHPRRPAYSSFGTTQTWAELDRQSAAFAAFLANEWKLGKGDRLAIMLPNLLQYPIALFGALRAGLTVVNVNPLYTARELQHQLEDSGAKSIVVLENFAATLQETIGKTHVQQVIVTSIGDQLGFPKGPLISFAVKHIKKMVPRWSLPGHLCFG